MLCLSVLNLGGGSLLGICCHWTATDMPSYNNTNMAESHKIITWGHFLLDYISQTFFFDTTWGQKEHKLFFFFFFPTGTSNEHE